MDEKQTKNEENKIWPKSIKKLSNPKTFQVSFKDEKKISVSASGNKKNRNKNE